MNVSRSCSWPQTKPLKPALLQGIRRSAINRRGGPSGRRWRPVIDLHVDLSNADPHGRPCGSGWSDAWCVLRGGGRDPAACRYLLASPRHLGRADLRLRLRLRCLLDRVA